MNVYVPGREKTARPGRVSRLLAPGEYKTAVLGRILFVLVPIIWFSSLAIGFDTALTILTVIGFLLILTGLRWPGAGLLGLAMITTLDTLIRGFLTTNSFLPFNTFNYILLGVMIWYLPTLLRIHDIHSRLLQILLLVLVLELFNSDAKVSGVVHILNSATSFGMIILFARAMHLKSAVYWMGIVSGIIAAVGGLVFSLQMDTLGYLNPNAWAKFPATGVLLICLAFPVAKEHRFGGPALFILAAINFMWTFLSGSRGNMLIGLSGLLFLLLWERRFSWRVFVIGISVLSLTVLSAFFIEQQTYALSRINKFFDPRYDIDQATSGRAGIAMRGWELFLQNPLGVGTGDFTSEVASVSEFADTSVAAHSGWIKVLAENGVPGILLFTAYVGSFFIVGWRRRNREALLLGALATFTLAVAFTSTEFQGKNLWFTAAVVTVMLHPEHYAEILQKGTALVTRPKRTPARNWREHRNGRG